MATAYARYVDGTTSSSSTTAVVNLSGCSVGDAVFVLISRSGAVSPTGVPTGWSGALLQSDLSTYGVWLYGKVLATGENVSSTWTWAAATKVLAKAVAYTGATIVSSAKGTYATASGTTCDCGSQTSNYAWVATFCSCYSTSSKTYDVLTGYEERRDHGGTAPDFWHLLADTNSGWNPGTHAPDFTISASSTYRAGYQVVLGYDLFVRPSAATASLTASEAALNKASAATQLTTTGATASLAAAQVPAGYHFVVHSSFRVRPSPPRPSRRLLRCWTRAAAERPMN